MIAELLRAVNKIDAFWDVTPSSLVERYKRFKRTVLPIFRVQ
jgi:hypothetical protein